MSDTLHPTPADIRAARGEMPVAAAAALVFAGRNSWVNWEAAPDNPNHRKMPRASWWLFLLRSGQARLEDLPGT
jgi:hypothetical protein